MKEIKLRGVSNKIIEIKKDEISTMSIEDIQRNIKADNDEIRSWQRSMEMYEEEYEEAYENHITTGVKIHDIKKDYENELINEKELKRELKSLIRLGKADENYWERGYKWDMKMAKSQIKKFEKRVRAFERQLKRLAKKEQIEDSAKTSQNQVPSGFNLVSFLPSSLNLDYGGGKYDTATEYVMERYGMENVVYDKYNRSASHNKKALRIKPDTITCFNVLNIIDSDYEIEKIINRMLKYKVPIYITTYKGSYGDGIGRVTTKGYQRNMKTPQYVDMLKGIVRGRPISRKGELITIGV